MKNKVVIIVVAIVVAVALLITGTILFLGSKFIGGGDGDKSSQSSITSSQTSDQTSKEDTSSTTSDKSTSSDPASSLPSSSAETTTSTPPSNGNITTMSVGNVTAAKGSKISVPVTVSSNQGFMGCFFKFNYDTSALKYTGYKQTPLLNDYQVEETNGTIKFMTIDTRGRDITANGTLIYLEFEVIASNPQVSTIKLTVDKTAIANKAEEYVPVKAVSGKVTIN